MLYNKDLDSDFSEFGTFLGSPGACLVLGFAFDYPLFGFFFHF